MSVFGTACEALDKHIPVRIELENGDVYPHEEVVKVDYNGGEAFWVKLSEEGAKVDTDAEDKPGDIAGFCVDSVKLELVNA